MNIKRRLFFQNQNFGMITIHPFDDELDDVAVDFLVEEVSEPKEMTDDDSDFSP